MTTSIQTPVKANRGADKNLLPSDGGNLAVINGNTEGPEIDIRGYRAIGLIASVITGMTAYQIHVSNESGGTFAALAIDDFPADDLAHGTSFIAEWNFAKIVYVGTVTGSGIVPYSLS